MRKILLTFFALAISTLASCNKAQTLTTTLAVTPESSRILVNGTVNLTASGGTPPYTWGPSAIGVVTTTDATAGTGTFVANDTTGIVTLSVHDGNGLPGVAYIQIENANLTISPATKSVIEGSTVPFTAMGGIPPYTFSVAAFVPPASDPSLSLQVGTVDVTSGIYTAPPEQTIDQMIVTDSAGNTARSIISAYQPLSVVGNTAVVTKLSTTPILPIGGIPPFSFNVVSFTGVAGWTPSDGAASFYAPAADGASVVLITDAIGEETTITYTY